MSSNVTASDWNACFNESDGMLVLSCTLTTDDGSDHITGAGLVLNTSAGETIASCYTNCSGGSSSVATSLNALPSGIAVGDSVLAAATGEANGEHFFLEEHLAVGSC
jgi:hypothetical protein